MEDACMHMSKAPLQHHSRMHARCKNGHHRCACACVRPGTHYGLASQHVRMRSCKRRSDTYIHSTFACVHTSPRHVHAFTCKWACKRPSHACTALPTCASPWTSTLRKLCLCVARCAPRHATPFDQDGGRRAAPPWGVRLGASKDGCLDQVAPSGGLDLCP
eukprot:365733-Chlamydomonas_euryale.AAC.31